MSSGWLAGRCRPTRIESCVLVLRLMAKPLAIALLPKERKLVIVKKRSNEEKKHAY